MMSIVFRRFPLKPHHAGRSVSSLVANFDKAIAENPQREAVRYKEKNIKWTAQTANRIIESHANVLLDRDYDFDVSTCVAHWLPEGPEKHFTSLSAAKCGLKVFDIDVSINTVDNLRACLKASDCRLILFCPEDDRLLLLRKAIPEFYYYNDTHGQWFHSKYYPNLKFFLHTGFDIEMGCLNLKRWRLPTDDTSVELRQRMQLLSDDLPLYRRATTDAAGALSISPWYTHAEVAKDKKFILADKISHKEYFEY